MSQNKNTSELKSVLKQSKKLFFTIGLFSFLINILMLVPPIYMLQIYDRVLSSKSKDTLFMLTLIVVVLFITMALLEIIRSKILIKIGNRIDNNLSNRIFDSLFQLEKVNPNKASSSYISNLTQMRQFLTGSGVFAFFDAPWITIYLLILFLFHPMFGYFALFTIFILLIITLVNEITTKQKINIATVDNLSSNNYLDSSLKNADVVNTMGMKKDIKYIWQKKYYSFLRAQNDASDSASVWTNLSKNFRLLAQSLILGLGAYLAIDQEITPGMMIAASIILGRTLAPLDLIISSWRHFITYRSSYKRIESLLHDFPKKEQLTSIPITKAELLLENMVLTPPLGDAPTIKGISLQINEGDVVAIIGNSGAGKSTLVKGILDIWPISEGKVKIDNIDIQLLNKEEIGSSIGYLPQDIELFEGTISQNISRFKELNSDKVIKAAKIAGVHEMIVKFPKGYDSSIGSGGTKLSGGQRQRIGLARAIYNNPRLIILDEPNSNLDKAGEEALLNCIKVLKENLTTVLIITHKENILEITNKIAILEDGTLKEFNETNIILNNIDFFNLDDGNNERS
ncbi:type I secretion system permease/ATPase [Poseidonibacter antarcticus]|uniref:type I secretion system permease/ATPase n=1 Tax=Poseidonibacter antarcticus TaxID=2478538 RepID=UPI001968B831|nr:type I secretion system permease/ATPase [Poseidonibacter antarcticus]